jgi:hypothetical protein
VCGLLQRVNHLWMTDLVGDDIGVLPGAKGPPGREGTMKFPPPHSMTSSARASPQVLQSMFPPATAAAPQYITGSCSEDQRGGGSDAS